jgi:hypothetical protein
MKGVRCRRKARGDDDDDDDIRRIEAVWMCFIILFCLTALFG